MAASIFGAAWWPIHVAVAWVLTRDRAFVERSSRVEKSLLGITVGLAADKVYGKPTERYFEDADDAWSALREEMAAGKVRASGTPFRRIADLQGHAVETNEIAREIAAVEIGTLRLQNDGDDEDCLVPEDWRVAHGSNWKNLRGYRNVQVFRDDVLRAFNAEGATPYVPDWERLPEAVKRVMATGVKEDQAKQAICNAIADRKIKVRFSITSVEGGASFGKQIVGTVRDGSEIEIPSQLAPTDFDWGRSRPLKVWQDSREGFSALAARWQLEWIEVLRADVSEVLCGGGGECGRARQASVATAAGETAAIKALAPYLKSNTQLRRAEAAEWCRQKGFTLSDRGFQNRVWPRARADAGLESKAAPGRRRKSSS